MFPQNTQLKKRGQFTLIQPGLVTGGQYINFIIWPVYEWRNMLMRNISLIHHLFTQAIHVPMISARMTEHVSHLGVHSHAIVPLNGGTCLCVTFP